MRPLLIREAAELLGVSDDTIRRWVRLGKLRASPKSPGRQRIDAGSLAAFAARRGTARGSSAPQTASDSNQFHGLVTAVHPGGVVAHVEVQAGPHRLLATMGQDEVEVLGIEPGAVVVVRINSSSVVVNV